MNYTFIFFICAFSILILSAVTICVAPIINGFFFSGEDNWGNANCKRLSDEYNYLKSQKKIPNESDEDRKKRLDPIKKSINVCKRKKAAYGLEYASLTCDVILGGICAILGMLHYLEIGKTIEKKSGLIGIITGTIGFILTIIYIIFSAYIFNNDNKGDQKRFPNRAILKWNGYQYVPNYDMNKFEENPDIENATFSELGQKQYNYDSDLFKSVYNLNNNYMIICQNNNNIRDIKQKNGCDYLWEASDMITANIINNANYANNLKNKYIYDRWITTIILGVLIVICNIGLILFGFLLFKNLGEPSSGSVPVPISSVNALGQ